MYVLGAMNQLGRSLACEWASDNIRVNSVCPWVITTPLTSFVRKFVIINKYKDLLDENKKNILLYSFNLIEKSLRFSVMKS